LAQVIARFNFICSRGGQRLAGRVYSGQTQLNSPAMV
jgi:hypothetical protein